MSGIVLAIYAAGIVIYLFISSRQSVRDVYLQLNEEEVRQEGVSREVRRASHGRSLFPFLLSFLGAGALFFLTNITTPALIISLICFLGLGVIIIKRLEHRDVNQVEQQVNYFLPVVMERLVMCVQAGLDIVPAIKLVVSLGEGAGKRDAVTELLSRVYQMTESGYTLSDALHEVSDQAEYPAVRHAFVHLGLASMEGGELTGPLRELGDATQLYYQDSVETELAQLPVKATMPLVLTFTGLIICFITVPILHVLGIMEKSNFG